VLTFSLVTATTATIHLVEIDMATTKTLVCRGFDNKTFGATKSYLPRITKDKTKGGTERVGNGSAEIFTGARNSTDLL